MGLFGGSSSKVKIVNLLSDAAQSTNKNLGPMFDRFLQSGNLPFGLGASARAPELFNRAYGRAEDQFSVFGDTSALNRIALDRQIRGIPAYAFDEGATKNRFQQNFANPMIETYIQNVLPMVEEQFAGIPGGFQSRDRARGVTRELNRFVGENITPRLYDAYQADESRAFQSGEAAAGRVSAAIDQRTRLPGLEFGMFAGIAEAERSLRQLPMDIAREQYNALISAALGFATTPTKTAVGIQGSKSGLGSGLGALAGLGVAAAMPGGLTATQALMGAGIGSSIGGGLLD